MGLVLLVIGLVGLAFSVLSIVGFEIGDVDVDLGDSGVGLLAVLSPFVTGFGVISGMLLTFTSANALAALGAGLATGLAFALVSFVVLGYLVGAEQELPSVDLLGRQVRIVDPVGPGRIGSGEVQTPLGARRVSVTADESYHHNDVVSIVARVDERELYRVERIFELPDST
ncbi:hypothetical protein [Gordonia rhizosphera]|uniref:Uncharacterized protein n=1 Tax=Gordonia rhizosphera NBRC 16068 TaxID=1108045 RepID=K6X5B8_9ACTN|nr:hypothetical protein [Gordonia rhizosphera]GAB93994.1 hypothetical protein GORHZ_256_00020 [Gordonia rhizosphera NBRC 16068]